jgi:hypothetical protein
MADPYDTPEERKEILSFYDGPFSTWREIHITVRGAYAGLQTGTFENLPKCPAEWSDEGQYYEGAAAIAYDLKRGSQSAILTTITLIGGYLALRGGS